MRYLLVVALLLAATSAVAQDERFEAGAQIGALDLRHSLGEKPLGIGGRFGFNARRWLTAESEFDYFPEYPSSSFGEIVALFGPKMGYRFSDVPGLGNIGVFFKVRPGIVHFGGPFYAAQEFGNHTKFALDLGIVWEHYFKTYGVFRIDVADMMIPFGNAAINVGTPEPVHPHNSNNFWLTLGLGVRF